MGMRISCLLAAAALALPLPAQADCAARIAEVESHPALETGASAGRPADEAKTAADEQGVRVDGGETVQPEGGPATPAESWFTDSKSEDKPSAVTHLDAARTAQAEGDEAACLEAVEQAEAALGSE